MKNTFSRKEVVDRLIQLGHVSEETAWKCWSPNGYFVKNGQIFCSTDGALSCINKVGNFTTHQLNEWMGGDEAKATKFIEYLFPETKPDDLEIKTTYTTKGRTFDSKEEAEAFVKKEREAIRFSNLVDQTQKIHNTIPRYTIFGILQTAKVLEGKPIP